MVKSQTTSDSKRISVVIPAFNAAATLPSCLDALMAQTMSSSLYEVIIVDDGSTDDTEEIVRRYEGRAPAVRYVRQDNRGPAAARNVGARESRGALLLFTDADCVPTPGWIEEMVRPFDDPEVVAVKGIYKTRQRELVARFAQMEFEDRYDLIEKAGRVDMVDTYAACFRKAVFLRMGGFDESFPAPNGEDMDLSFRLDEAGFKLVFTRLAVVFHTHPACLGKYLLLKFSRAYWRMSVYRRHPAKVAKDSYTPTTLKLQTGLMALALPLVLVSPLVPWALLGVAALWVAVLALAMPFARKAWTKDRRVALAAPGIIFLRSAVLAVGSLLGVFRSLGLHTRLVATRVESCAIHEKQPASLGSGMDR
ncbi:MAG: glycosyltransferase [Lentisphaerota bacterium]